MPTPERTPERDSAITAMLPLVAEHGWSMATLRRALAEPEDSGLLFPGGTQDLIETFADLADRQMEEAADATDMAELGLTKRVRAVIALRFAQQRPYRDAIRRALAILALPGNSGLAARITARTVDSIWHAAGDRSADFSWYTKRAILAAVYSATLLYWLRDHSEDAEATLEFLDRRLKGVGRIGKLRARIDRLVTRFTPATT
jgi:ubiquinone biosynthesis protein COQ9